MARLESSEERRRMRVYGHGLSDGHASAHLGLKVGAYRKWRAQRGLPANAPVGRESLAPKEHERRLRAYNQGLSDREAAKRLNVGLHAFRVWRQRNRLPPHYNNREAALLAHALDDGGVA